MAVSGVRINVPRDVRKILLADEQVLLSIKQSRLKALFTPDTIVATNRRVIRYSPSGFLGWHKDIEDYRYEDMANSRIARGVILGTITIGHRLMSESLVLEGLRSGPMNELSKVIEQNVGKARAAEKPGGAPQPSPDALQVLQLRYARGEITKEQLDEMKRGLQ